MVQAVAGSSPVAHLKPETRLPSGFPCRRAAVRARRAKPQNRACPQYRPQNPRAARGLLADAPPSERERYRRPGASLRAADGIRTHDLLHGKQTGGRIGTAGGAPEAARSGKPSGLVGVHLAAFGTTIGTTGASARGTGSLRSRRARRASSRTKPGLVPTALHIGRLAAERARLRRNNPREHGGLVVNDASWSSRASSRCPRRQPPRSPRRSQIGQPRSPRDRGGLGLASYGGRQRW